MLYNIIFYSLPNQAEDINLDFLAVSERTECPNQQSSYCSTSAAEAEDTSLEFSVQCKKDSDVEDNVIETDSDSDATDSTNSDVEAADLSSELMRSNGEISTADICIIVQLYASRFNLSKVATSVFLKLVKGLCAGYDLPDTTDTLQRRILLDKIQITYLYFCDKCEAKVPNSTATCVCGCADISTFASVAIDDVIRKKFQCDNFLELLEYNKERSNITNKGSICDVQDGLMYEKLARSNFTNSRYNLSLKLSVDGVALSNSSTISAWPILLKINELPPHARRDHAILAGVWVGKHPIMSKYLEPLCKSLNSFFDEGVPVKLKNGSEISIKLALLSFHGDLPARAKVLNMMQFNGKFPCIHCEDEGECLKTPAGGSVRVFKTVELK